MRKEEIINSPLYTYLFKIRPHFKSGVTGFKSIVEFGRFLEGYEHALNDYKKNNFLWYFWIWSEGYLHSKKYSGENYISYIDRISEDFYDGINTFYDLLELFVSEFDPTAKIYSDARTGNSGLSIEEFRDSIEGKTSHS